MKAKQLAASSRGNEGLACDGRWDRRGFEGVSECLGTLGTPPQLGQFPRAPPKACRIGHQGLKTGMRRVGSLISPGLLHQLCQQLRARAPGRPGDQRNPSSLNLPLGSSVVLVLTQCRQTVLALSAWFSPAMSSPCRIKGFCVCP